MKKKVLPVLAAVALMTACGEETRNGQLTLSGSQPVKIIDQESKKAVEFLSGALKVEFSGDSGRKVTVKLEQGANKAKFSGKVNHEGGWNFTVRGKDIGQPVDFASQRSVELYGPVYTSYGTGGFCGFDGTWMTEETWQKGNEDWKVGFADTQTGAALGEFKSRLTGKSYLLESRNVWCRENPRRDPYPHPIPPRYPRISQRLSNLQQNGVSFQ
jgi:hypothetical protein